MTRPKKQLTNDDVLLYTKHCIENISTFQDCNTKKLDGSKEARDH